eukprot:4374340-Prymnesium_polylepis.1
MRPFLNAHDQLYAENAPRAFARRTRRDMRHGSTTGGRAPDPGAFVREGACVLRRYGEWLGGTG